MPAAGRKTIGRGDAMYLRFGYEMAFDLPAATPMFLNLFVHPTQSHVLRRTERLFMEPDVALDPFTDPFGNHCARIVAPQGKFRMWYDNVAIDCGQTEPSFHGHALSKVQ